MQTDTQATKGAIRSSSWRLRAAAAGLATATLLTGCGGSNGGSTSASQNTSAGGAQASAAPSDAGCASVGSVKFDKTKFALHAGLAFGAFHHFVYGPARAHQLHGVVTLGKAALATAFTVHELKLAKADAESSPTLCKLVAPFDRAAAALTADTAKIKSGKATTSDLDPVQTDLTSAQNQAKADGAPAPDVVPTASQLSKG